MAAVCEGSYRGTFSTGTNDCSRTTSSAVNSVINTFCLDFMWFIIYSGYFGVNNDGWMNGWMEEWLMKIRDTVFSEFKSPWPSEMIRMIR